MFFFVEALKDQYIDEIFIDPGKICQIFSVMDEFISKFLCRYNEFFKESEMSFFLVISSKASDIPWTIMVRFVE